MYTKFTEGKKTIKRIQILDVIFLITVIIIVFIPNSKFNKRDIDYIELRMLAKKPVLIKNGRFNRDFPKEFENYYNDRFRKRNVCIDIYVTLNSFINARVENAYMLKGKENWLFSKEDNCLKNFKNEDLLSQDDLRRYKENLERFEKQLNEKNIKLIIMIPPDKHRIYGEFFPDYYKKKNKYGSGKQLEKYLYDNSNLNFLYLEDDLKRAKKDTAGFLYFKSDMHWSDLGAYVGYKRLINEINSLGYNVPIQKFDFCGVKEMTYFQAKGMQADGVRKLNLKKYPELKYVFANNCAKPDKKSLKLAIIGDSFSSYMLSWLNKDFIVKTFVYNSSIENQEKFNAQTFSHQIEEFAPDILVLEFLNRYSYKILDLYKD